MDANANRAAMRLWVGLVVVGLVWTAMGLTAHASPVAYWQLEDAAPGTAATTVSSVYNSAAMLGTASGATRVFNADTPAGAIVDGGGSGILNPQNDASLQLGGGGGVDIVFSPLLEPQDFTIEFFMKAAAQGGFPGIVEKPKNGGSSVGPGVTTWGIGKASSEVAFIRVDSQGSVNHTTSIPGTTADGQWHHFALTYDSATSRYTLYRDYTLTAGFNDSIDYDGLTGLHFGGGISGGSFQIYNGLVDEIRFSDRVLAPSQFLHTVNLPEPAGAALAVLAAVPLGLLLRRRRAV